MASTEVGGDDSLREKKLSGPSAVATTKRTCPEQKAAHGGKPPPSAAQPGRGARIVQSHLTNLGVADAPRSRRTSPSLVLLAVIGSK